MYNQKAEMYEAIATRIILYHEKIIGPVAWVVAGKVPELRVTGSNSKRVVIAGEPKSIIEQLVKKFEAIFGNLGKLYCIDASEAVLQQMAASDIPDALY